MTRTVPAILLAVVALAACTPPTPEQQVVDDAAEALGGRGMLAALTTISMEGEGEQGNLGQGPTPDVTPTFSLSDYRESLELAAVRRRVEQTRTPNFIYFRGPDPIRQVRGIDGDIAYDVAPDGSASRAPQAAATDRRLAYYLNPITAVRAALDPEATLSRARAAGGEGLVDITTADAVAFTLGIDPSTRLPTSVSAEASHPNLRDVVYRARFRDYENVNGAMLPMRVTVSIDDIELTDLRITSYTLDGDVADLSAPEAAASAAPVTGPPPVNVTVDEVADGVWFLAGGSHHSVLVELSDHTVLYEAPSEARTLAVIARARELVPDKPLTHLVSSHHHFDHSGGVRAAIAEGLAVITHAENTSFYQELAERPSTIVPDALADNPQPARIEAVEDHASHGSGSTTVELYHIAGNPHGDALLMAYLPRQRLLIEADAFSPSGRDYHPYAANLLENIRERGLRVERIVPIHGDVVPLQALIDAVGEMTN